MKGTDYYINKYKDSNDYLKVSMEILNELNEELKVIHEQECIQDVPTFMDLVNKQNTKYNVIAEGINKHKGITVYKPNAFWLVVNKATIKAIDNI